MCDKFYFIFIPNSSEYVVGVFFVCLYVFPSVSLLLLLLLLLLFLLLLLLLQFHPIFLLTLLGDYPILIDRLYHHAVQSLEESLKLSMIGIANTEREIEETMEALRKREEAEAEREVQRRVAKAREEEEARANADEKAQFDGAAGGAGGGDDVQMKAPIKTLSLDEELRALYPLPPIAVGMRACPRSSFIFTATKRVKYRNMKAVVLSLDGLLDYNREDDAEMTFEVSLFAENFHDYLLTEFGRLIVNAVSRYGRAEAARRKEESQSKRPTDRMERQRPSEKDKTTSSAASRDGNKTSDSRSYNAAEVINWRTDSSKRHASEWKAAQEIYRLENSSFIPLEPVAGSNFSTGCDDFDSKHNSRKEASTSVENFHLSHGSVHTESMEVENGGRENSFRENEGDSYPMSQTPPLPENYELHSQEEEFTDDRCEEEWMEEERRKAEQTREERKASDVAREGMEVEETKVDHREDQLVHSQLNQPTSVAIRQPIVEELSSAVIASFAQSEDGVSEKARDVLPKMPDIQPLLHSAVAEIDRAEKRSEMDVENAHREEKDPANGKRKRLGEAEDDGGQAIRAERCEVWDCLNISIFRECISLTTILRFILFFSFFNSLLVWILRVRRNPNWRKIPLR
jgi:hypothetical protein